MMEKQYFKCFGFYKLDRKCAHCAYGWEDCQKQTVARNMSKTSHEKLLDRMRKNRAGMKFMADEALELHKYLDDADIPLIGDEFSDPPEEHIHPLIDRVLLFKQIDTMDRKQIIDLREQFQAAANAPGLADNWVVTFTNIVHALDTLDAFISRTQVPPPNVG